MRRTFFRDFADASSVVNLKVERVFSTAVFAFVECITATAFIGVVYSWKILNKKLLI